tara:strand:+ start:5232 stop:5441 length:210 start_codon:yes stop_codon:yes gene_type:complete
MLGTGVEMRIDPGNASTVYQTGLTYVGTHTRDFTTGSDTTGAYIRIRTYNTGQPYSGWVNISTVTIEQL